MATERILASARQESRILLGGSRPHHGEIASTVGNLHPHEETHPVQPAHGRRRRFWLGVRPERLAVVHAVEDVLDVAVRGKDQGGDAESGRQTFEVLRGERMQPAEPVRTGHRYHSPVGEIDYTLSGRQQPLFAHGIAEVPGHSGIDPVLNQDAARLWCGAHAQSSALFWSFLPVQLPGWNDALSR